MNKELRKLFEQIEAKTNKAKELMSGENADIEAANKLMDEVDELKTEYATKKRIYDETKRQETKGAPAPESDTPTDDGDKKKNAVSLFVTAIKAIINPAKYATDKRLVEETGADGGFTVPEDIQTKIEHWPEAQYSLLNDIDVVPVSTNKGARTYQKKTAVDTFADLDENGAITKEITAPKFERITYTIQDRAGFMPISNDLIDDSDANILAIVTEWLARANIATANAKILGIINTKEQTEFDGIAGIKYAINVTLGQAYKGNAKIFTNDDGLNYLDNLVDGNGRPLLNPDVTDSTVYKLRCGTVVVPIRVLPNSVLATTDNKVPFIVGDLKEAVRKYDRRSMSIKASDVATIGNFNAYAMNMTLLRAIMRDDYKALDSDAFVNGYIDISAVEDEGDGN